MLAEGADWGGGNAGVSGEVVGAPVAYAAVLVYVGVGRAGPALVVN